MALLQSWTFKSMLALPSAVLLTFGVLAAMLLCYRFEAIRPTEKFELGVIAATVGIALAYSLNFALGLFGITLPLIHTAGFWGILISLVVTGIAAMNLVMDFDFIAKGAEKRAPKYMEWYGAFALLVTLVWQYLEILRLAAILSSDE